MTQIQNPRIPICVNPRNLRIHLRIGFSRCAVLAVLLIVWLGSLPRNAPADEIDAYLADQRQRIEDARRPIDERAGLALDTAATLNRAADEARTPADRLKRLTQAADLLQEFNRNHPEHPRHDLVAAQAGINRWAIGHLLSREAEAEPTRPELTERATRSLDESIRLLRSVPTSNPDTEPALAENVRYRLARALADRAALEPADSGARRERQTEALGLLETRPTNPELMAHAELLRAESLTDLGRTEEAETALRAAESAKNPPSRIELVEARVALRLAESRFRDAEKALESLPPEADATRRLLALRIALARRSDATDPAERAEAEANAIRLVGELRERDGPEARLALVRLGRAVEEPGESRSPEDFALLAEAHIALGDLASAARLAHRGAERAEALDRPEDAPPLRYRAAALLYRAGDLADAADLLGQVADDPLAGTLRPRALLLRALALSRGVGEGRTGFRRGDFLHTLERLIEEFSDSTEAGEARWLLGQARRDSGDPDAAATLWRDIPRSHPRWLDARLAVASLNREAVEAATSRGDADAAARARREAVAALDRIASELPDGDPALADLALARADLELVPGVDDPAAALAQIDHLLARPLDEPHRDRAKRLRVVALTGLGRHVEAEQAVRDLRERASLAELLDLAHRLDHSAAAASTDLLARRFGAVLRLVARTVEDHSEDLPPAARAETRLRLLRAEVFRGDLAAARRALSAWPEALDQLPPDLWNNLADLALRLGETDRAVAAYRAIADRNRPGSLAWLQARYGHALALSRDHPDQALQILDATALLHPDLGGETLKSRFETLRNQLNLK